ncbi:GAF domain-containing protein, partial [Acidobacteria bacterium ACD]|nr:GAF domain-containing protein [Acidobacteria bacterium ACD]
MSSDNQDTTFLYDPVVTSLERLPLSTLLLLSRTLGSPLALRSSFSRALETLREDLGAVAGAIALTDEERGDVALVAVSGAKGVVPDRVRFRAGEGIAGRVVKTGRPVAVPSAAREPSHVDRLGLVGRRRGAAELSLVCVPLLVDDRAAGALSLYFRFQKGRELSRDVEFLSIAASMLGQALKVSRLVERERGRLLEENRKLRDELRERHDLSNIVGTSHPMREVFERVAQAAPASTTVLILGESGTGKELVAHAIHYGSPRAAGPFVKVNGAAFPESLVESELFGHEAGAFTGADRPRKGRFELAHGGTLFLDEVGELPLTTQVKLLRVLQEREVERLGGTRPVKVDVRLIAATNRDLARAVAEGRFREDLFYRLEVFPIWLPPLRERKSDILLLADHFVEKLAAEHGRSVRRISTSAIDMLMSYHWPGNVRELANCLERAVLICEGGVIHA